ncbi:MAG: hypothetical protein KGZ39_06610 [Simkania sp.]|nr:hypothetical protein [Simkania sp.]
MTTSINQFIRLSAKTSSWGDFGHDLALLKAYNENVLDVTFNATTKQFQLVKKSFFERVGEFFSSSAKQARLNRQQEYVKKTHAIFKTYPQKFTSKQVADFYTQGLHKWSIQTFNRSLISTKIQDILSKDLAYLRTSKSSWDSLSQEDREKEQLKEAKLQAELAISLGVKPKKNGKGVNGSIIYLDIHGKPIGIFKEEKAQKPWIKRVRRFYHSITPSFITDRFYLRTQSDLCRHEQTHAEIAASVADRFFSIDLIPLTRRITLENKPGSFMLWQHQMQEAKDFPFSKMPNREELYLFQKMVIYDYLFGNLDRHLENWLLKYSAMKKLQKIAMIDNGNAFPESLPTERILDSIGRRKMYQWKTHPWSRYAFDPRITTRLRMLTPEKINQYLNELRKQLPDQGAEFITTKRRDSLQLRASILRELGMKNKSTCSPKELGEAYSVSRIQAFKATLKQTPISPSPKALNLLHRRISS